MSQKESLQARMQTLEGRRVLVVGMARSGRAAVDFFRGRGATVTVSDSRPPWSFDGQIAELLARKIGVEFGEHGAETFLRQELIVVSPGVPWDLPALAAARDRGVPVVAEVEAAAWYLKGSLAGVTGSNGKTTTTSLLGRMLEASGIPTWVGGNIGKPLVSMVDDVTPDGVVVAELSSFQLEGTEGLHPRVAVLLNLTPNHLDRHPSFEAYRGAKARIFRNQTAGDYAVLNADDPEVAALEAEPGCVPARRLLFSRRRDLPEGVLVSAGRVVYRVGHLQRDLFSPRDVRLRGDFNLENVLAATAAACVLGADFDALAKAVREFRGVEHRLEHAGDVLGVEFYNDSKATSVDATVKALGAFDRGVHLILGGKDKGAPYAPLVPLLAGRVREVLLIGAAAERIERELAGSVELVRAGDLATATRRAFERARPGDVVLLSPACSSYDQFTDFEERGRKFKELVESLAQDSESSRVRRFVFEQQQKLAQSRPAPPPRPKIEPAPAAIPVAAQVPAEPQVADLAVGSPAVEANAAAPAPMPNRPLEAPAGFGEAAGAVAAAAPEPAEAGSDAPAEALASELRLIPEPDESVRGRAVTGQAEAAAPERVYVYEFDAEERAPLEFDPATSFDEVELAPPGPMERSRGAPGVADEAGQAGEPLIFEVRPAFNGVTVAASGGQAEAQASPGAGGQARRRAARRPKAAETPAAPGAKDQDRFPGM